MAETKKGQKFNRIPAYIRKVHGKRIQVAAHARSNPNTSTGKKGI